MLERISANDGQRALLVCVALLGVSAQGGTYRLEMSGVDQPDAGAFRTFGYAVSQLRPGDSLEIGAGTWTSDGGLSPVNCTPGGNAVSGRAEAPIAVRATPERMAVFSGDGRTHTLSVESCSHWVFDGLTIITADFRGSSSSGSGVSLNNTGYVSLRRLLVVGSNRYAPQDVINTSSNGHHNLVEECEVYDFAFGGIDLWGERDVARRNYLNSRGRADLPGGPTVEGNNRMGDFGITVRGDSSVCENNISEANLTGYRSYYTNKLQLLGNISLSDQSGILLYGGDSNNPVRNAVIRDAVVVSPNVSGIALRYALHSRVEHSTLLGKGLGSALGADDRGQDAGSAFIEDTLASGFSTGFRLINVTGSGAHLNAFVRGDPFEPLSAFRDSEQIDPQLGDCTVFIPHQSPMKGRGRDGGDLGATVLFQTEDGALTPEPLWNPSTGAFPCGAIVPGINDLNGKSCLDVHLRLKVGTERCKLPDDYLPVARFDRPEQTTHQEEEVTLDATASTPSSRTSLVAFDWEQIRGPTGVRFPDEGRQKRTQVLKLVEPGSYAFRLVVQDSAGRRSAPATATVEVGRVTRPCAASPSSAQVLLLAVLLLRQSWPPFRKSFSSGGRH